VGTDQPVVRMYDVNTSACFVGAISSHQVKLFSGIFYESELLEALPFLYYEKIGSVLF
jgi:hypothetical protein